MQLGHVLPRSGFVPGETIPVTVDINNTSEYSVNSVQVKLVETLKFTTQKPYYDSKFETKVINQYNFEEALESNQRKLFKIKFHLDPNYEYKIFNGCNIITCEYQIVSKVGGDEWYSSPSQATRIVIGTIPFSDVELMDEIVPTAPTAFNPTLPENGVISEQPLPSYNDITSHESIGWNMELKSPSGAPLASTEKIHLDEDLRKSFVLKTKLNIIFNFKQL